MVLAPLVALFGPELILPRALSLVATLGLSALLGRLLRSYGTPTLAQAAAAVGVLSCPLLYGWQVVARPDALALLLGTAALVCCDAALRQEGSPRGLFSACALAVAAAFTKQNNVLLILAAPLVLFRRSPRRALLALAGMILASSLVVLIVDRATGGAFWHSLTFPVLHMKRRPYKLLYLREYLVSQLGWLALLAVALLDRSVRSRVSAALWTGLGLGAWQLLEITRAGAGQNYFLPFHALCLAIGGIAAGDWLRAGGPRARLTLFVMTLQLAANAAGLFPQTRAVPGHALEAALRLERYLGTVPGPILLDRQPQLWLKAGQRERYVEVASLGLDWYHGRWQPEELERFIEAQGFALIVLRGDTLLPPPTAGLVARHYESADTIALVDGAYYLLLPRKRPPP